MKPLPDLDKKEEAKSDSFLPSAMVLASKGSPKKHKHDKVKKHQKLKKESEVDIVSDVLTDKHNDSAAKKKSVDAGNSGGGGSFVGGGGGTGRVARTSYVSDASNEKDQQEPEQKPIVDVFFMSWPELYLETVESLILILSLYLALYLTNFIVSAGTPVWKVFTALPALLSSILLVYIVKCAVMLGAIHAVDCDAIVEVLEQTEGAQQLTEIIREKVINLMKDMGPDPQSQLINLFSQIDADGSGSIRFVYLDDFFGFISLFILTVL
jgi:hypothetical protein